MEEVGYEWGLEVCADLQRKSLGEYGIRESGGQRTNLFANRLLKSVVSALLCDNERFHPPSLLELPSMNINLCDTY